MEFNPPRAFTVGYVNRCHKHGTTIDLFSMAGIGDRFYMALSQFCDATQFQERLDRFNQRPTESPAPLETTLTESKNLPLFAHGASTLLHLGKNLSSDFFTEGQVEAFLAPPRDKAFHAIFKTHASSKFSWRSSFHLGLAFEKCTLDKSKKEALSTLLDGIKKERGTKYFITTYPPSLSPEAFAFTPAEINIFEREGLQRFLSLAAKIARSPGNHRLLAPNPETLS